MAIMALPVKLPDMLPAASAAFKPKSLVKVGVILATSVGFFALLDGLVSIPVAMEELSLILIVSLFLVTTHWLGVSENGKAKKKRFAWSWQRQAGHR